METTVTGCNDCPLFDETGTEYHVYCHHPLRPLTVTVSDTTDSHKDVQPTEDEIRDYIGAYLRKEDTQDLVGLSLQHGRYPNVHEPEILNRIEYNPNYSSIPITPDWCPLNTEAITIKKVKNDN